ncbi:MAG: hypothetical protein B7Z72_07410, partial [Gemmatimonadetes bacterium 21-71-4]
MDRTLTGIPASPGVAVGSVHLLRWEVPDVPHRLVPEDQIPAELRRFHAAVDRAKDRLNQVRARVEAAAGREEAAIFDVQHSILEDTDLLAGVEEFIRQQLAAEKAFDLVMLEWRQRFARHSVAMLRERVSDLTDVHIRVLSLLLELPDHDPVDLQPSSVDLHLDSSFRVFRNNRYAYIDVRVPQPDLTELVSIEDDTPFILHPGEFVLGQTLEWVELPDDLVARLEGKALALDTPVPTPGGWRTMGDLEPGDVVFDETGAPTAVLAATPPMLGRPCREVVFSDGTRVVADAEHQWVTVDKAGRRHGSCRLGVRTTEQIRRSI